MRINHQYGRELAQIHQGWCIVAIKDSANPLRFFNLGMETGMHQTASKKDAGR